MLSILVYVFLLAFTLACFLVVSVVFVLTVAFDRKRVVLHWFSRVWALGYFRLVPSWKLKVEGLDNIDRDKAYVAIVNHRSMFDILLMYVLPMNFKWVSKREVYKWPVFGWVLWMHGDVAIDRASATAVKKMITDSGKWLSEGVSVMVFPEGTRSKGDGVGKFKEGAFMLAKHTGVGILPCVGAGTGTALKGWKINFRNTFRVKVLPAVSAEEVRDTDAKAMARRMQELISGEYDGMK